jgi:hypothetical protein
MANRVSSVSIAKAASDTEQARSFAKMLERTIRRYQNRAVEAGASDRKKLIAGLAGCAKAVGRDSTAGSRVRYRTRLGRERMRTKHGAAARILGLVRRGVEEPRVE